jgi:hypothetical protein
VAREVGFWVYFLNIFRDEAGVVALLTAVA